jgi:hypothetical protein
MPVLRPSASDYTKIVKSIANIGSYATNPQGSRPPSSLSVPFNISATRSNIVGSSFQFFRLNRGIVAVASAPPPPESVTLNNAGSFDGLIVKYDSSGTLQWARRIGGTSGDFARSIISDSAGNIIVTGNYTSTTLTIYDTDGTTAFTTLANAGSNDIFIVKYNSSGTPQWARRIGGSGSDAVSRVATDSNGNIIVVGHYDSNPVSIYGSSASFTTLSNAGSNDVFIVKYNSSGDPQWARRIGGINDDTPTRVATDSNGNIVVVGYHSVTTLTIYDIDGTTAFTLANAGAQDGFIVKYDSSGDPQWARRIGGTGTDVAYGVATDSNGNIIVYGSYVSSPVPIYGSSASFTTLANAGVRDVFIVKYDSSGDPQWARRIGGSGEDGEFGAVATDSNGNIVVVGYYASNPISVFGSSASFTTLSNAGSNDVFIVKYDSSGDPQWARRIGGSGSDTTLGVATDSSGNIVVAGYHDSTTLTIYNINGTTAFTTLANAGSDDIFIVKYNSSGTPQWAKRIAGTGGEYANTLATDSNGNIVVAGSFNTNPLTIT